MLCLLTGRAALGKPQIIKECGVWLYGDGRPKKAGESWSASGHTIKIFRPEGHPKKPGYLPPTKREEGRLS